MNPNDSQPEEGKRAEPGLGAPGERAELGLGAPGGRAEPGLGAPGERAEPGLGAPGGRAEPGLGAPGGRAELGLGAPNAFFLSGYIESWGRGIEKIARECKQHGIQPPAYDSGMSGLMLTFHASDAGIKYHLDKLRTLGVLRHVGPTKAGHWEIIK